MTTNAPLVLVSWLDASFSQFEEAIGPDEALIETDMLGCTNYSVGYKIRDDVQGIKLAMEWCDGDNKYRHLLEIPRAYVQDVISLSPKRKPRIKPTTPAVSV